MGMQGVFIAVCGDVCEVRVPFRDHVRVPV